MTDDSIPNAPSDPEDSEYYLGLFEGLLISAQITVLDPLRKRGKVTVELLPGLNIDGPVYTVYQLELAAIEDILQDEDGKILIQVEPICSSVQDIPDEMVGESFLLPLIQIGPAKPECLKTYFEEGLLFIAESEGTIEEKFSQITQLYSIIESSSTVEIYEEDE